MFASSEESFEFVVLAYLVVALLAYVQLQRPKWLRNKKLLIAAMVVAVGFLCFVQPGFLRYSYEEGIFAGRTVKIDHLDDSYYVRDRHGRWRLTDDR